jgi:hypothetical protein
VISVATAIALIFIGGALQVSVHACTCRGPGAQFIRNNDTDDKTLILPRDARGVLWWYGGVRGQQLPRKDEFTVQLLSGARERDLDFQVIETQPGLFLIAPLEKLFPGNRYRFSHKQQGQPPGSSQKVEAIVENTSFFEIKDQIEIWLSSPARTSLKIEDDGGTCSRSADAIALDVRIDAPEAIERWRFALLFETVVNGKRDWHPRAHLCGDYPPGSSWQGHGTDVIFAECDVGNSKHAGLSEGAHDVYMTISVPGTKLAAVTKKHSFMLMCPSPTLQ